jgi:hypothetical protein
MFDAVCQDTVQVVSTSDSQQEFNLGSNLLVVVGLVSSSCLLAWAVMLLVTAWRKQTVGRSKRRRLVIHAMRREG